MTMKITTAVAGVLALGAAGLTSMPASAAPAAREGASSLVLVSSGGWASRVQGKTSTYGSAYGHGDVYGYPQSSYGYAQGPYRYGRTFQPSPYGYEGVEDYNND